MTTLYNNKFRSGVYGRSFMFTNHRGSRQYQSCPAGKFRRNRKRQSHEFWKSMGKWIMKEHVIE